MQRKDLRQIEDLQKAFSSILRSGPPLIQIPTVDGSPSTAHGHAATTDTSAAIATLARPPRMSIRVEMASFSMPAEAIMDTATRTPKPPPESQLNRAGFWKLDYAFLHLSP